MNRLAKFLALLLLASPLMAGAQVNPCSLLTQSEIERELSLKLSGFANTGQAGVTKICSGQANNGMSVMVMVAPRKADDPKWADPLGSLEKESRDAASSIKAQIDVKRFGSSMICTTIIPPKPGPYSTQCVVVKKPNGASITVLAPSRQEMASIEKLRPLAEKMLGRL